MKKSVIAVVLTLLALTMEPGQAFNCQEATVSWLPCVGYLIAGGDPSPFCCSAIRNLKPSLGSKDDKRVACECFKEALGLFPAIKEDLLASLPKRCGAELSIPISKNMNCDNIPFGHNGEI